MKGLFLFNGKIYTMDPKNPYTSALAIQERKIVAVGKNTQIKDGIPRGFKTIDLKGKTVLPGFIDSHTHFVHFALNLDQIELKGVKSEKELALKIKSKAKSLKRDRWLFGRGWDKNIFKDKSSRSILTIFHKKTLDKVLSQNPVALKSKDGHVFWLNSLALKILGIDKYTLSPSGGEIEKDISTSEPTGLLKENACELVDSALGGNVAKKVNEKRMEKLFTQATEIAHKNGIVGVHDCGGEKSFETYERFLFERKLLLRVFCMIEKKDLDSAIKIGFKTGFGNDFLKLESLKLYSDGTLGSQTALMFQPFEGSKDNYGMEVTPEKELTGLVRKANAKGISVAIHAIGDKGVNQALNSFEKSGHSQLRNRIEHIQLIRPEDIKRFAKLNVIASVQPLHATSDRDIADKYWGKRCRYAYPYKTLLENGATLCFGSDLPVEDFSPLKGIYAAVTRKREGERRKSWHPFERVSVEEAVYAYTLGGAYASGDEEIKGSIQPGKLADLVVLSRDIFKTSPQAILKTKVLATIFDGRIVWGKENIF
jgi:predicted amidohydrolase YtcJ